MEALPSIVSDATKRISSSLTELYYAGQRNGATARQIDALRKAAEQSGEGADRAESSFNAFSQRIRDAASGTVQQYKSMFGKEVDPYHTFDAYIDIREKIEELRNTGRLEDLSRANSYAKTFGFDEDALVEGRMPVFTEWLHKQLNKMRASPRKRRLLSRVPIMRWPSRWKTSPARPMQHLFDKFGAVLDKLTKWLDDEDAQNRIVKFFTDLATQIGYVFEDLSKLGPAFTFLWEALKEVGDWLQKIMGQPDSSGLAGVRHLLEFIAGAVMARFILSMVIGFARAFAPVTALIAALAALGIVGAYAVGGAAASTGGQATGGLGGDVGGATSGGRGSGRRGKMGYRGANKGMGAAPTSAEAKANEKESWDFWKAQGLSDAGAAAMVATEQGESGFNPRSFGDATTGGAHGSFQWHMDRVNKILAATGIDVRTASHLDQLKAAKWEGARRYESAPGVAGGAQYNGICRR